MFRRGNVMDRAQIGGGTGAVRVMRQAGRMLAGAVGLVLAAGLCGAAMAQKQGGTLRIYHRDSPASMSIHEEGTVGVMLPMMPVFNNLMLFDQHVAQNSM